MRVFVYEHLSAGDDVNPSAASLRTEGWAMLSALLADFSSVPGVKVQTMLGAASAGRTPPPGVVVHASNASAGAFRRLAAESDWTLVVAPESDGVLPEYLEGIELAQGRSLGSTPAAAQLAGDKFLLVSHLRGKGVPTPHTVVWPAAPMSYPAVCKPRHGAGSLATYLVHDEVELRRAVEQSRAEHAGDMIVQPHVAGIAASVAFLVGHGRRLAMPAAVQHLSADGRFRYLGGSAPLPAEMADRAITIAAAAVDAVDGLRGYVGVDVVLGAGGDAVIEINPRLTTSYVGLRALARFNMAEALLAVVRGDAPPSWEWRPGPIRFTPEGCIA